MICFAYTVFNVPLLLFVTAWRPQKKILGVLKLMVVWKLVYCIRRVPISHLKTVGTRRVIWSKLPSEDQQMLGATVQNSVARVTWCPGFLQLYMILWFLLNPLNPELNPICYFLALLGAHHFPHISRIRVKSLTFRRLMSYIYIYIYIWSTHSWCF